MIVNELVNDYLDTLTNENSEELENIRDFALRTNVPILSRNTEGLLKNYLYLCRPKRILEVGTAIAYSALMMAECTDAEIVTIEKYPPRLELARKNIAASPYFDRIVLVEEDASAVLERYANQREVFDFIFMDAAKAQYIRWLPNVLKILSKGGVLFCDNVLQEGELAGPRVAVCRRNRGIYSHMREYLYTITHHGMLESVVLPVGDGVAVSIKK